MNTTELLAKFWGISLEEFIQAYGPDASINQQGAITAMDRNHEVPHGYVVHPHGHVPETK